MDFIDLIKCSFDSLRSYTQQELIQIVQILNFLPKNITPYIVAPQ